MPDGFPNLHFGSTLLPSQQDVIDIADRPLSNGERRLHIVAPPNSGKTVLGLSLWTQHVRRPALTSYAFRGAGKDLLQQAQLEGRVATEGVREKSIFS